MASAIAANKAELIAIANAVATEKMIDKSIVIEAMEEAIQKSARNRYGAENDIRAKLDPRTGDLRLWRVLEVVEECADDHGVEVFERELGRCLAGAALNEGQKLSYELERDQRSGKMSAGQLQAA